jgi:glyoxylase-like metal-dependent hydrolase (beta-lactamase superfamily II)
MALTGKTTPLFLLLAAGFAAAFCVHAIAASKAAGQAASTPELEYLKAVNLPAPPQDPQLLFLLMAAFGNAGQQTQGVDFLTARLKEFGPKLPDSEKALYLSAISVLRAQHASSVPLYSRIGYVRETIAMLDEAKKLSSGKIFVVNWISGVVRAQLPSVFKQKAAALSDLKWCEDNISKAPDLGWLREVEFRLAKLAMDDGNQASAQDYLKRSGYQNFGKRIVLTTPFSEDALYGHRFGTRRIREVIPGKVFSLSGFEFTEFYFVLSQDGKQLIGIDTGTTAESAKTAYEALREYAPKLPALTNIFITHSHWDHIGGYRYFRSLEPKPKITARSNYREQIDAESTQPPSIARAFFGEHFRMDDLRTFTPDATIDHASRVEIGGTQVELIPIEGGETRDGMFVYIPGLQTMFVGDFIMPYVGAPFVSEGSLDGLFDAIDIVVQKHPRFLLHGHEPLTVDLQWLCKAVLEAIHSGEPRNTVHESNLIPPGLIEGRGDVQLPYLVLREHVIDRLFQQNVGYWQADLTGLDHLTTSGSSAGLIEYAGLSEKDTLRAAQNMIADGKYDLAVSTLDGAVVHFGRSDAIAAAERLAYSKLMERYQNIDPFKFILYSAKAGERTIPMQAR